MTRNIYQTIYLFYYSTNKQTINLNNDGVVINIYIYLFIITGINWTVKKKVY